MKPTLPTPCHIHLAKVNVDDQEILLDSLPTVATLKHYQPWNRLINRQLGSDIANAIAKIFRSERLDIVEGVYFYDDKTQHGYSHKSHQQRYGVKYRVPISLELALEHIALVAGEIEKFYQSMNLLYAAYYQNLGSLEVQHQILRRMQEVSLGFGFDIRAAEKVTEFVVRIVPTSSQLRLWVAQLQQDVDHGKDKPALEMMRRQIKRRDRLMVVIGEDDNSMNAALIKDTYRDPNMYEILHTWPAHSSAIYLLDDIKVGGRDIIVDGWSLHPAIVSAAGGPEKLLGATIMRDLGSSA